jgi:hypothetical protein
MILESKKCVFTICAKNYLAQALTLQECIRKYDPSLDFYIFLADLLLDGTQKIEIEKLIPLNTSIVPKWEEMAFKYAVLEFSVSLKPFCVNYLFERYDMILYLDADIYVASPVDIIFEWLHKRNMVITPHKIHLITEKNGVYEDKDLLFAGIYNAGFFAIKNSEIGKEIISWWMKKLENECYNDKYDALFTDQHWLDFIPASYQNDIMITTHQGCNMAIWNLHERELIVDNNEYLVKDLVTNDVKKLIFFHFSGFDPYSKTIIDRKVLDHTVTAFPSIIPLIEEYAHSLLLNGYDWYSKAQYSFNFFSNGEEILPIHRRIFRTLSEKYPIGSPFSSAGILYTKFKKNNLISKKKHQVKKKEYDEHEKMKRMTKLHIFLKIFVFVLGIERYQHFLNMIRRIARYEYQDFLSD